MSNLGDSRQEASQITNGGFIPQGQENLAKGCLH